MSQAADAAVPRAQWYFDFASPFAYLQFERFDTLPRSLAIDLKPIVLGAILAHLKTQGPAETPHKRIFTYRMAQFRAEQDGIAFRIPPVHPFHPIRVLRLAVALGATPDVVRTIFRFIWAEGRDVTDAQGWQDLCERLGLPADDAIARAEAPETKAALRTNTETAIAAGIFGVPTFAYDGELYWGDDATALFRHCLAHPEWLRSPDVARLQQVTIGVQRER
ncbi:2-hydroxychromene-2-carboxylate isomerase [Pandoraea apista]|uniref:2-hydroxychromene-2-carboxylate isomerase n=1 Tax=Pandoraea apista TaxID=93218 RepID=A0ABX9ZPA2_9BURK|nr:2-hydroxychromene-2-carboxylate isomerase [Pandoraea apista]PTD98769.1 2-hydroxychromene-2-carboxylate isomerase [Pandoraea apista]RRJ34841.1 2-hydroxychromene-2-carboxylate isomerase [Pandoraea apista]RRJ80857.1 2-hydroxychromene-2-carboxylate isomerase [Pandoraea apista]RSD16859.1 2-hydroxychromene-2-carboxylate isomerase [Pandoraea apista]RSD21025.1 2-hydroxychromene-2-carboxylate isomerase [Pandoraea apista]